MSASDDHRPKCKYWDRCYNRKKDHTDKFLHPRDLTEDDPDFIPGKPVKVVVKHDEHSDDDNHGGRDSCSFGMSCYQKTQRHFRQVAHPGEEDYDGPDADKQHWSVMTKLDIDESSVAVTAEPPPLNCMFVSTHIFNAKNTENRRFEQEREHEGLLGKNDILQDDEHVLGVYSHSYAIEQSCLPWLPTKGCCTHRDELTNTLKITSKRVEFSIDEAHGCWPDLDDDNLEVGKGACCLCGCCPGGLMQTKALGVGDISGYSREVVIPRVVYLSTFRFALFFYMLTVILVSAGMMAGSSKAFKDAVTSGLKSFDETTQLDFTNNQGTVNSTLAHWQPSSQQPGPVLVKALAGLAGLLLLLYLVVDATLKWGWKFVACVFVITTPIVLYCWYSTELFIQYGLMEKGQGAVRGQLAPFQDMIVVASATGWVMCTLPIFLLLGYFYIAFFALRIFKLTLNFSNKVSYSVTLQEEQLDDALNKIANLLGFSIIAEATPVEGAGWTQQCHGWGKKITDIPVDMPGTALVERPFTGGGGCKLTDRALALHHETYSFFCGGPELTQVTKVFLHKTMTKLTRTQHMLSMSTRIIFLVLGLCLAINGLIQTFSAHQAQLSDRTTAYLAFIPCPSFIATNPGQLIAPNCAEFISKTLLAGEAQIVMGVILMLVPIFLQCAVRMCECTHLLEAEYNWGTDMLSVRMERDKAEEFEEAIVTYAGKSRGGTHGDHDEKIIAGPYDSLPSNQCMRLCGDWFGFTRGLTITDKRIHIQEDDLNTSITYFRDSMTEADIGPMGWCVCGCGCPCEGWHRPKGDDPTRLSLNFGWQTTANKAMALPGTNLATTERFLFDLHTAEAIMAKLDPIIGNFIHHEWSPDAIQTAVHG